MGAQATRPHSVPQSWGANMDTPFRLSTRLEASIDPLLVGHLPGREIIKCQTYQARLA